MGFRGDAAYGEVSRLCNSRIDNPLIGGTTQNMEQDGNPRRQPKYQQDTAKRARDLPHQRLIASRSTRLTRFQ